MTPVSAKRSIGASPIPGERFGFGALERAQAAGDLQALRDRGRRAGRVRLDELQLYLEEPQEAHT